jgi:UDP-N-acetylmuramate dehydrogenase
MNLDKPLSSFGLPGTGEATVRFKTPAEAVAAIRAAHARGLPVIPMGAGTNCVFMEPKLSAVFLRSRDQSIVINHAGPKTLITAGAGLPWDDLVKFAVPHDLQGLEYLSGIPGTCGAAPVQNIGAYGAELASALRSVEVIDLETLRPRRLSRAECGFGYRRSIFNTSARGQFLITSLTLALTPSRMAAPPEYPELAKRFSGQPTLSALRRTVLRVRRSKLPDYKTTPNCGSFFKNPIISQIAAAKITKLHPTLPSWPGPDGKVKISAAWLIAQSGLCGRTWGKISISTKHALILVNRGETKNNQIIQAIEEIEETVHRKFNIRLAPEPNLLDAASAQSYAKKQFAPAWERD